MAAVTDVASAESLYPESDGTERPDPAPAATARSSAPFPVTPFPSIANARLLRPGDPDYDRYLPLHNRRNSLQPSRRILCSSTQAVADSVKWVRDNGLPLAVRSGGHCYEGFSQNAGVVIDTRGMGLVTVDAANQTVSCSAGANLGKVYRAVAAQGFGFAAGSCPTVGVPGHTLGGGQGLLGRKFGLTSDNLIAARLVDATGTIHEVDETHEPDLLWAARGGGGGNFFIATRFQFRIFPLSTVRTFRMAWKFPNTSTGLTRAAQVFAAWQAWAPQAPDAITAILKITKDGEGKLNLRIIGQSTGTATQVRQQINAHLAVRPPTTALSVVSRSFMSAVELYGGSFDYQTVYMKAKSDVVTAPLAAAAMNTLFTQVLALPSGHIALICDPYGGAIASKAPGDTAFVHRGASTYIIQYYASWAQNADTQARIAGVRNVHAAMRPYMPGGAYVNYPDTELPDPGYATAYWGSNLPRLQQIKAAIDPGNFFHHAQSVPLP